MKCTSCKSGNLNPSYLDKLFRAHTCDNCGGSWVLIEDYVSWKENNPEFEFVAADVEQVEESSTAILCPMTGTIMRKLHISKDSKHKVDYSVAVGGVWLDKGEWELLKSSGLAGSLNGILTQQWQTKIQDEKAHETFENLYKSKFGDEDYEKVKALRLWLESHPQKADLRSFLLADDPYSAKR